jgi:hypothetical protein
MPFKPIYIYTVGYSSANRGDLSFHDISTFVADKGSGNDEEEITMKIYQM